MKEEIAATTSWQSSIFYFISSAYALVSLVALVTN